MSPRATATGHPLVNPRRSAHASIRGYLYQACLSAQRWLELADDEVLICEGDEDLDRLVRGGDGRRAGGGVSEQHKDYRLAFGKDAVRDVLAGFAVTYHALRERGDDRHFRLITTAVQPAAGSSTTADLLDCWATPEARDDVVSGARTLLGESAAAGKPKDAAAAAEWLDGADDRWPAFVVAVEWTFGQPNIAGVRQQIALALAARPDVDAPLAATMADRLIIAVLDASTSASVANRTLDNERLTTFFGEARADLVRWATSPVALRLRAVLDEVEVLRPVLVDGILTAAITADTPPGKVLVAGYEVVPFDDSLRPAELALLTSLCSDAAGTCAVQAIVGEGGSGKTRLMMEWCRRMRSDGWHAGFLPDAATADDAKVVFDGVAPRLVVVDYAETRLDIVLALLDRATRHGAGPQLRFVLLARQSGAWWKLLTGSDAVEDLVAPRSVHTIRAIDADLSITDVRVRQTVFLRAAVAFADARGQPQVPGDVPDLSDLLYGRTLYLHMEALLAADRRPAGPAGDVLSRVLRHERSFWLKAIQSRNLPEGALQERPTRVVDLAMAVFTLTGGAVSQTRAKKLLSEINMDPDPLAHTAAYLDILRSLYGSGLDGAGLWLRPLEPDVLGEQLVREAVAATPEILSQFCRHTVPWELVSVFNVLTRIAAKPQPGEEFLHLAFYAFDDLPIILAFSVVMRLGGPLGRIVAKELSTANDPILAVQILELWGSGFRNDPDVSWSYNADVAEPVVEALYVALGQRNDLYVKSQIAHLAYRRLLAWLLSILERWDEAIATINASMEIIRQQTRDDDPISGLQLASLFGDLAQTFLASRGSREAGDGIRRQVVAYRARITQT